MIQSETSILEMVFPNFWVLDFEFLIEKFTYKLDFLENQIEKKGFPGFKIDFRETLFPYRVKTSGSFKTN